MTIRNIYLAQVVAKEGHKRRYVYYHELSNQGDAIRTTDVTELGYLAGYLDGALAGHTPDELVPKNGLPEQLTRGLRESGLQVRPLARPELRSLLRRSRCIRNYPEFSLLKSSS